MLEYKILRPSQVLFKYKYALAFVIFLVTNYFLQNQFGYTGCSDGWISTSIGKQGACSHHGGVESNRTLLLILSAVGSIIFLFVVNSQYRIYDNIIVSSSLPAHPLESYKSGSHYPTTFQAPTDEAKSRKNFVCKACNKLKQAGETYRFYNNGKYRVKYCHSCADNLKSINEVQKRKQQEYLLAQQKRLNEIKAYYAKNAKGFLKK